MPDHDPSPLIGLIDEAIKLAQAERRATPAYLLGSAADEAGRAPEAIPHVPRDSERRP